MNKIKKLSMSLLVLIVIAMGISLFLQKRSHESDVTNLHNKIARQSETIEVHEDTYEKKTEALSNLSDLLKVYEAEKNRDSSTIKELRKRITKKSEQILSTNRLALKWKEAYEAEADASQDETDDGRLKVSFERDFGYLGVSGFTLTNPAYASVRVQQNRPLVLTTTITQGRDKQWSTYVTSSEENISADIKIAAVNPYLFETKWYEKISIDVGSNISAYGLYPYVGTSYPFGPLSLSAGLSASPADQSVSWYTSFNYSWAPFSR